MNKSILLLSLFVAGSTLASLSLEKEKEPLVLSVLTGKRFMLTGAAGSGKTTLISLLREAGLQVAPEAFTTLFHEAQEAGETPEEFFKDALALRYRLYERQCALEAELSSQQCSFLDRGTPDIYYFGELFGVEMPEEFAQNTIRRSYDGVLVVEVGPEEIYEQTEVRKETYEETCKNQDFFKKRLKQSGNWVARVPFMPKEERVERVLSLVNQAYLYTTIIDCFAGKNNAYEIKPFLGPLSYIEIESLQGAPFRFYGVPFEKQNDIDYAELRKQTLSFSSQKLERIIQVVGDSGPHSFDEKGTTFGRAFLRNFFDKPVLIEYGFTGHLKEKTSDINAFVTDYLKQHPEQSDRVLANILGHTVVALTQWGCTGSTHVRNFMVVYNADGIGIMAEPQYDEAGRKIEGYTTFGDDVTLSDSLLSGADGDELICLEGGAQSFCQVVNVLRRDVPVHMVYNMRYDDIQLFSAARFLYQISLELAKDPDLSKERLHELNQQQIASFGKAMFNEKKGDFKTKKQLYAQAIAGLIDEELYKKIPQLITFYDAQV